MSETQLCAAIRQRLALYRGVLIFRNNTGKRGRVTYGLGIGSADLVGLVEVLGGVVTTGRFFALEVKLPGKTPTREQWRWAEAVRKVGGFACVVRSVEEAVAAVIRCRLGELQ